MWDRKCMIQEYLVTTDQKAIWRAEASELPIQTTTVASQVVSPKRCEEAQLEIIKVAMASTMLL